MTWDFLQRYDDSWIWRCVDHHDVTESSRNFADFEECVADAARHGYVSRVRQPENNGARRTRAARKGAIAPRRTAVKT